MDSKSRNYLSPQLELRECNADNIMNVSAGNVENVIDNGNEEEW